ncbi:MAG: TolC family protein [Planctomycetia bacterium]|nr:TolC family protein [Planctomycetia bacterium]
MHRVMITLVFVLFGLFISEIQSQTRDRDYLSIETAVNKAIENNPELQTLLKNIDARKAIKLQSRLKPNPELGFEAENIFGSNGYSGLNSGEMTASISHNILLAGKINKRVKVAEMEITLAEWDYESKRLEVITDIRRSFTKALITQKIINKNNELIQISNKLIQDLKARVEAGRISPAEVSRAQIILNMLQIDINRLEAEYDSAIFELTTLINAPDLPIELLKGEFKNIINIPDYDFLLANLNNNPDIKRFTGEYDKQKAVIKYEESKAIPDLTVSAGFKRMNDVSANTFLIGASIPLPIFNRNQGSIQEAQIRLNQTTKEFEAVKNKLTLQLKLYYNKLKTLISIAQKLKNESIPDAEKTFEIIQKGNLVGRFTMLDVLDAERTLFEIQNQYLDTLGNINIVVVEIEGLTIINIK